jgi:hypothetical protein
VHSTIEAVINDAMNARPVRVDPPELHELVDSLKSRHNPIALDVAALATVVVPMLSAYGEQAQRDHMPLVTCLRSCMRAHLREHGLQPSDVHEAIEDLKRVSVVVESLARMPP